MTSYDQEKLNIPVWISIEETCKVLNLKVKTIKDKCRNGEFVYKTVQNNRKVNYFIKFGSLPIQIQNRFFNLKNNMCFLDYSNAPSWAKAQAEKYIPLIKATEFMRGVQIINYLKEWNICNPDCQTSYSSLMRMKQRYETDGVKGLLSKRGKSRYTTVKDDYFDYFKNLYLVEGAPSSLSCWDLTLGYAIKTFGIDKSNFPSCRSFIRRLEREIPKQSIYLARLLSNFFFFRI